MVTNDNIDINIRFNTVGADGLSKVSNDIKVFGGNVEQAKGSIDGFDRVIQKFSVQTFAVLLDTLFPKEVALGKLES